MGAHVQCPRCEQAYALSDEQAMLYAGREFECAQCTLRFIIPTGAIRASEGATLAGQLPREQMTAAAIRAPAAMALATPGFGASLGFYPSLAEDSAPNSRLAACSMICGIIGLLVPVVPGLLAIILGALALRKAYRGQAEGAPLAAGGIAVGCAGLVLSSALFYDRILPMLSPSGPAASVQCVDRVDKIKSAMSRFASEHAGRYPDGIESLITAGHLQAEDLICPFTSDTKAAGATLAEVAQHIRRGGHCSYVYTGAGLTSKSPSECVLLYEALGPHHQDGIRVLFVDGRVQNIGAVEGAKAMARLAGGQNPPWSK